MEMASVDKEKIHEKKKESMCHKKGGPNKTKQAQWTQIFSIEKKKKKRRAKYVSDTKGKEGERENEQKYRKK